MNLKNNGAIVIPWFSAICRQKLLILLFKNVWKISNYEKSAKMSKNLKKP
jgi:hypothetical protein